MANNENIRQWSTLYKKPVYIPDEGRNAGLIEDFYFQPDSSAVYALRITTRVEGEFAVPVTGITEVTANNVSLINGQMMTKSLYHLPQGSELLGKTVVGENGHEIGTIGEVYLNVARPTAMHIEAFELASSNGHQAGHGRTFSADDVVHYDEDQIVLYDRVARRL